MKPDPLPAEFVAWLKAYILSAQFTTVRRLHRGLSVGRRAVGALLIDLQAVEAEFLDVVERGQSRGNRGGEGNAGGPEEEPIRNRNHQPFHPNRGIG